MKILEDLRTVDMKRPELLLRPTVFSRTLLAEIWDDLSLLERIDFLLRPDLGPQKLMVNELRMKALSDPSPVVRMLAVKCSHISENDEPDLHARLKADPSALVRAVITDLPFLITAEVFKPLSHIERLGLIALTDSLNRGYFAGFIVGGLQSQTLPEEEAAELICEFVRNPKLTGSFDCEPLDGLDWHHMSEEFKAIWNLTTCTPSNVHNMIAWEYPLKIGGNWGIPNEILNRMNDDVIEILVWRQYKPLLKLLETEPERFSEEIKKAAQMSADHAEWMDRNEKKQAHSELDVLREELAEFRAEMKERLDVSRRRGLFG